MDKMSKPKEAESTQVDPNQLLPIEMVVDCSAGIFKNTPVHFDEWAPINYLIGSNGSGKTTLFKAIMEAARRKWPNRVKILGTGRLGPLEKSVTPWIGDHASRLFPEDNLKAVYDNIYSGTDTSHQAFQLLEKRLDLQIRVLGFLRHVFKRDIHFQSTRRGLKILGISQEGGEFPIIDECHGLKELITTLTFLYDNAFSVLGIDEPELHLHPQFQRFLLDELRSFAGDPDEKGKKLIFIVTHSPIFLELREFQDLSSVIVFAPNQVPKRAQPSDLSEEEQIKVRQALPSFNSAQRELLFSNAPIIMEGPTDTAILMNVASRLELPLGAAGLGIAPMGGKYQLLAFRALMSSLAKPNARFIVDLDAATDAGVLHCLDDDQRVIAHLVEAGLGERTLSKVAGELIGLLRDFITKNKVVGNGLRPGDAVKDPKGKDLAITLQFINEALKKDHAELPDQEAAKAINGKFKLIRSAARAANVLILSKGPIEAYYKTTPNPDATDFAKQQAFLKELNEIWNTNDLLALEEQYSELLDFIREAGLLKVPMSAMAREPLANLIHLLQTEIHTGRVESLEQAKICSRILIKGYWDICELTDLDINNKNEFSGTIKVKTALGGEELTFDHNTRPYELTGTESSTTAAPNN